MWALASGTEAWPDEQTPDPLVAWVESRLLQQSLGNPLVDQQAVTEDWLLLKENCVELERHSSAGWCVFRWE